MIELFGSDKFGEKIDEGVRYAWKSTECENLLESAAFINKTKGIESDISGYTTSVSFGCVLKNTGDECRFCRTGAFLPFERYLTAIEIAKQNIFMVLSDIHCGKHISLKNNKREFAYMGQGEPGYSYQQIRIAIKITNFVMHRLNQQVYRHIISTAGVEHMFDALQSDFESGYFDSKVTLHFSLHGIRNRSEIMPINVKFPYEKIIERLKKISVISGEKVCLGVLLFNELYIKNSDSIYTTKLEDIKQILNKIEPSNFRFSFSKYNNSPEVGKQKDFKYQDALFIKNYFLSKGYEAKLFYSFGENEDTACGLLYGKQPSHNTSKKWKELEHYAEKLAIEALECI